MSFRTCFGILFKQNEVLCTNEMSWAPTAVVVFFFFLGYTFFFFFRRKKRKRMGTKVSDNLKKCSIDPEINSGWHKVIFFASHYTKSAVLDFVSRKTVAHFATALIRYVFRYFGLGSLSLTRRPAQNPLFGMTFLPFVKFRIIRYLLNDSVISPKNRCLE